MRVASAARRVGLVGDQQADDAEVRQLARFGHARHAKLSQSLAAAASSSSVTQAAHWHAEVRIGQQACA